MKQLLNLQLIENTPLNPTNVLLKYRSARLPRGMKPGQFVEVRVDGSAGTFLRRPISINWVDEEKNELWLLVQQVGDGTATLAQLPVGSITNMILPLGNGFTLPSAEDNALLIGGGVGTAPLLYLGKQMCEAGMKPSFLLGGRTAEAVLQVEMFCRLGNVYITTDDGTGGEKGVVTHHSILQEQRFDKIYTCGPKPMMKAVVNYARKNNIWCEVSLENTMACGFGVCLCCVEPTVHGHQCVCTEGPVFNSTKLTWESEN